MRGADDRPPAGWPGAGSSHDVQNDLAHLAPREAGPLRSPGRHRANIRHHARLRRGNGVVRRGECGVHTNPPALAGASRRPIVPVSMEVRLGVRRRVAPRAVLQRSTRASVLGGDANGDIRRTDLRRAIGHPDGAVSFRRVEPSNDADAHWACLLPRRCRVRYGTRHLTHFGKRPRPQGRDWRTHRPEQLRSLPSGAWAAVCKRKLGRRPRPAGSARQRGAHRASCCRPPCRPGKEKPRQVVDLTGSSRW